MNNVPRPSAYTGQGFPGEKFLASAAVILTIVSTVLLIKVSVMQMKQMKEQTDINKRLQDDEDIIRNKNKKS